MNCYEKLSKDKQNDLENHERKALKGLDYDVLDSILSHKNRDDTIKNWKLKYTNFYNLLHKTGFI
jgi:hypothetical protein